MGTLDDLRAQMRGEGFEAISEDVARRAKNLEEDRMSWRMSFAAGVMKSITEIQESDRKLLRSLGRPMTISSGARFGEFISCKAYPVYSPPAGARTIETSDHEHITEKLILDAIELSRETGDEVTFVARISYGREYFAIRLLIEDKAKSDLIPDTSIHDLTEKTIMAGGMATRDWDLKPFLSEETKKKLKDWEVASAEAARAHTLEHLPDEHEVRYGPTPESPKTFEETYRSLKKKLEYGDLHKPEPKKAREEAKARLAAGTPKPTSFRTPKPTSFGGRRSRRGRS